MWNCMRHLALVILLSISSILFSHEVTKSYDFNHIREFSYVGMGKIEIKQGDKNQLILTANPKLLEKIVVTNQRGVLSIALSDTYKGIIKGVLIVNNLSKITLRGDVSVDIDKLKGKELMIVLQEEGSSLIEGFVEFDKLAITISGNSEALLKGEVKDQVVYISGSGIYEGEALKSKNANVHIQGAGTAFVYATDKLEGSTIECGHIHYVGTPKIINDKIQGGGRLSPYKNGQKR